MEDLLILGGVVALVLLLNKGGSASLTVAANTPAAGGPLPTPFSASGGSLISGGYTIAPAPTFAGPGLAPATGVGLPTYVVPAPAAAPPPAVVGGAAGNAGTGGIPLGALRLGLGPILPTTVAGRGGWLINHRIPGHRFGRVPGLSRVPVRFA